VIGWYAQIPISSRSRKVTVKQVIQFENISRMEVYRRMRRGDAHFLRSTDRREIDGQPGRLINPRSMTPEAQKRWKAELLRTALEPMMTRTGLDEKLGALNLPALQREVVLRRHQVIQQCLNHDYKAQGFPSYWAFLKSLAAKYQTSPSSIKRWVQT
jgi:hypothetical protein